MICSWDSPLIHWKNSLEPRAGGKSMTYKQRPKGDCGVMKPWNNAVIRKSQGKNLRKAALHLRFETSYIIYKCIYNCTYVYMHTLYIAKTFQSNLHVSLYVISK